MRTIIKYHDGWFDALDTIFSMVKNLPEDRLKENYSPDRLNIDEWIALSYFEGGFSSIAYRDIWNNNCRILNRFYKLPEYRDSKTNKLTDATKTMILQQVEVAQDLNFDCAFMSRDTKFPAFKHYKKYIPGNWIVEDEMCNVYENGYQYIMWTPLNKHTLEMSK